eukprot:scaffold10284_cov61-Cyclotella_meneghiniana.AAC.1
MGEQSGGCTNYGRLPGRSFLSGPLFILESTDVFGLDTAQSHSNFDAKPTRQGTPLRAKFHAKPHVIASPMVRPLPSHHPPPPQAKQRPNHDDVM